MISSKTGAVLAIALSFTAVPAATQAATASTRIDVYASGASARNADAFGRIQAGMKADQVLALLGAPDAKMRFDATRTTAWDYAFRDTWGYDAEFSVIVGDDGVVSSTVTTRLDD